MRPECLTVFVLDSCLVCEKGSGEECTERDGGDKDHDGDAHAHGWIGVESAAVVGEPDYCCGDDDAEVVCAVADDVDEDAHHGEVPVRFVGDVLGVDEVFVMDVLVELASGVSDGSESAVLTFPSISLTASGSVSVEASGAEPSPLSVPWSWL